MSLADELKAARESARQQAYIGNYFNGYKLLADAIDAAALTERKALGEVGGLVEKMRRFAKTGRERRPQVVINRYHADTFDEVADALQSQATELATLKQQLAEREDALRDCADPMRVLQREADAAGSRLNGVIAHCIANNHEFVKDIARRALTRNTDGAATCNQGSAPENGDG
jgi:ABC-type transporter Mla subunit MlaD